jgi:hypothetical protein
MENDDDQLPCPRCPLGELCLTDGRMHLHCAICGYTKLIPRDEDDV